MTSRHMQFREVTQRNKGHGYSDKTAQRMIDFYRSSKSGKSFHPSTSVVLQSTPPPSPAPEGEQQAVPTGVTGTREDGHGQA